jgi:7,8-dihydroneopterin aldolase/epimerase/oxygenase
VKKNIKMAQGVIKVEDFEFHIAKGWHEVEHKVENHFKVTAEVVYERESLEAGTFMDYEELTRILKRHMISDTQLLETIAEKIIHDIRHQWPFITSAKVVIRKLNPAFMHMKIGAVVVEING